MKTGKYILRSAKYLFKLLILFTLLFALIMWSESSTLSFDNLEGFFQSYFETYRGWLFTAAVLLWCALYPKVEFVVRCMDYDMVEGRDAIIKAFGAGRMVLEKDENGSMKFRGESPARRVWFLGDDAVTVTRSPDGGLVMEGPRRFVGEAVQRIPGYMDLENVSPLKMPKKNDDDKR